MATIAEKLLEAIRFKPMDDDQLAKRLGISQRQSINQAARRLQSQGLLDRYVGSVGKIVNALPQETAIEPPVATAQPRPVVESRHPSPAARRPISEDEVKTALHKMLVAEGFDVSVAWGRSPGIDVDARHPDGRRWVIEAKAEKGVTGAQQHNYFLGMLGELVQRMGDPNALYGIAIPDNRQYRGLVQRLPRLARDRLRLHVFWITRVGDELSVSVES